MYPSEDSTSESKSVVPENPSSLTFVPPAFTSPVKKYSILSNVVSIDLTHPELPLFNTNESVSKPVCILFINGLVTSINPNVNVVS